MKKCVILTMVFGLLICLKGFGQEDSHLKRLTDGLLQLRKSKSANDVLNKLVINWSVADLPKITLMDEIKRDPVNEYRGSGANKFRMNQLVTYIYSRQNTEMVSKGDYFNSTEKDIYYSAIEKNVKKGATVTYTLTGHEGEQEFVFIAYAPNTRYSVKVNGVDAKAITGKNGVKCLTLRNVRQHDSITFSITNNSNHNESFVILNHNPQK